MSTLRSPASGALPAIADDADAEAVQRARHRSNIESMAADMQRPVDEIGPVYEEVLEAMASRATVHDFLPVLVAKNVRRIFDGGLKRR
jgi:hypothetical protein